MQPGAQLSAEAVAGIKRFVASAYPGLAPDRVTVVDGSGAVQGAPPPPDGAISKERRVQNAVQSALDSVLGQGSAVVRVSIRTVGSESQSQSTRTIPHGALSADVARERGSDSGKTFDKERTIRRYAYDTLSERRITPADAQAKLSVAVFLNANRVDAATGSAIASLVRACAGADLHGGDDVVVEAVPFARAAVPAQNTVTQSPEPKALAPAIVACAIALFSFASLPRVAGHRAAKPAVAQDAPARADPIDPRAAAAFDALADESPQAAAYVIASLEPDVRSGVLSLCAGYRRAAIESFLAFR
jgi:flagellar M-ring protein FliF